MPCDLRLTVPLVLRYLARCQPEDRIVTAYRAARRSTPASAIDDGLAFLEFVTQIAPRFPHLHTIVRLERALLVAQGSTYRPDRVACDGPLTGMVGVHPDGAVIAVEADPVVLLLAVMTGEPLPAEGSGCGAILVGPGLRGLMRLATRREEQLVGLLAQHRPAVRFVASSADEQVLRGLLAAGVLELQPAHARGPVSWD